MNSQIPELKRTSSIPPSVAPMAANQLQLYQTGMSKVPFTPITNPPMLVPIAIPEGELDHLKFAQPLILHQNQIVGDYRVTDFLTAGGMAALFSAQNIMTGEPCILKIPGDPYRDYHFSEVSALSEMSPSKHIVGFRNAGKIEEMGLDYLVIEQINGKTLGQIIEEEGRLPLEKALAYIEDIVNGLESAQKNGVIHKDLNAENVVIREPEDKAVLIDFGLSKVKADPNKAPGALIYRAPWQLMGDTVDHRADIYALGILLYKMLTGKLPIETKGKELLEVYYMKLALYLELTDRIADPAVQNSIEKLINRMTKPALNAPERINSYQEIRDEIRRIRNTLL